jgi:hypothetical protein
MGTVFLAEQIGVGNRPVALKVLSRKLLDDSDFLLRFQNEAASTGRIHHPNVVTIYESGQADEGTPYIAMEFLEGESLREALKRRGALPVQEAAEILQQAARGLKVAYVGDVGLAAAACKAELRSAPRSLLQAPSFLGRRTLTGKSIGKTDRRETRNHSAAWRYNAVPSAGLPVKKLRAPKAE